MTDFSGRDKGQEAGYALSQEIQFKAEARRNRLLGLWAAKLMGIDDAEADDYAKEVIKADFEEPGDQDVFRKIRRDFDARGVTQTDHQIRRTMDEFMAKAVEQIQNEA